ncbi:MAG: hypothetical protein N2505_03615 [Endomicrobia bacterium]|nr:hypothetical protein [Endomicrobiia bacterium]
MAKIYSRLSRRLQIFFILFIFGNLNFKNIFVSELLAQSKSSTQSISYNKAIKELSEMLEELRKDVENVKQQLSLNSQDIQETSSSLIELNKKIEKINNDILDILKKIENISQEISLLKKENIELREKIETQKPLEDASTIPSQKDTINLSTKNIDFDDYQVLNKKIEDIKKELQEIKETQKLQMVSEIKDPNLKRIVTSPYFTLTIFFISIFALIAAF